jgi:hypothetical protein
MAAVQKQDDKPGADTAAAPPAPAAAALPGLKGRAAPADAGADELSGAELLAAARVKAPNLTAEFVAAYKLGDDDLRKIARGEVPPPPTIGPVHTSDLYLTPGGWQSTPVGVKPENVGKNAISR